MQLKFAFLLMAFALVGAEEEACGEEEAGVCFLKLLSDVWEESSTEQECASLAEASSCVAEFAKDCTEEARNGQLEEARNLFRILAALKCPQKDLSPEAEKCVDIIEPELNTCVEDSVTEVLEHLLQLSERPKETEVEDEIKCRVIESISKCAATKVAENCGEEASVAALAKMLNDDEIRETCKIPDASKKSLRSFFVDELAEKKRK